jgi:hypothetical protein
MKGIKKCTPFNFLALKILYKIRRNKHWVKYTYEEKLKYVIKAQSFKKPIKLVKIDNFWKHFRVSKMENKIQPSSVGCKTIVNLQKTQ